VLFFSNGPGGAISFSVNNNRTVFVTTLGILDRNSAAAIPDDGGWHHIAVVHENGVEFRFYVDGVLADTIEYLSGTLIGARTDTQFYIGSEPTGGLPYVGKIDRLKVSAGVVAGEDLDFDLNLGEPQLTIRSVVEVSWPSLPSGYVLQSTTDLSDPESWENVPGTPSGSDGQFKFYFPVTLEQTYYRLVKP
ncbi:MAG: LamG domain-containing protein, partial [Verrucomicrobiae bacterium]|nr:LamG domain-containing protein [Verrucomicrobiae bacterium]